MRQASEMNAPNFNAAHMLSTPVRVYWHISSIQYSTTAKTAWTVVLTLSIEWFCKQLCTGITQESWPGTLDYITRTVIISVQYMITDETITLFYYLIQVNNTTLYR